MHARRLDGLRVLVTRDRAASERFASRIEKLGAAPIICPAIEFRFRNPPGFDEAIQSLDRFDWLVLTSANAVRAIADRYERLGIDPGKMLQQTRIAVVGSATRTELERLGGRAEIESSKGDARSLASDLIAAGVEGGLVLFPASRIARPELPRRLREAGAGVVRFAVYETIAPEQMSIPSPSDVDVAMFASPSAVHNVAHVVDRSWLRSVPVICIGRTTASAAVEAGAPDPLVAAEPSMAGIIDALLEFQQQRLQEVEHHGAR